MTSILVGILTVSDSCFFNKNEDISGAKLEEAVLKSSPKFEIICKDIVPDDKAMIARKLMLWTSARCDLILTTGGTGFSPRDNTPEATKSVIEREAPGITFAMISKSLSITPMAMLSRAICGIRDKTLILNLPGSPKGATECFSFVESVIPHAIALLTDSKDSVTKEHSRLQTGFDGYQGQASKVKVNNVAARSRSSPYPLVAVSDANSLIAKEIIPTGKTDLIPIKDSLHRILAEDVYSKDPLPPFNASIKDGYAVLTSDGSGPRLVKNFSAAGDNPTKTELKTGEAIRICTGAPIPPGADAVVQVENTSLLKASEDGTEEIEINIDVAPKLGQDIRPLGSDMAANTKVLNKLDVISAGHIGVMAAVGRSEIKVFRCPSVGLISTGNELVDYRRELQPGEIRDSNKVTLINLLHKYHIKSKDHGLVKDDPSALKAAISRAFAQNDVVVTTGGVSMGEFDLIKAVLLEDFGATIHFGRVDMKPGKPTTFASVMYHGDKKLFFGLPGNPVSSCVTCLLFVIPAVRSMERQKPYSFPVVTAILNENLTNKDKRTEYVRAHVELSENKFRATSTGNQMSSRINSLVGANGLLILPGGKSVNAADSLPAILFDDL